MLRDKPPIMVLVGDIAEEICPELMGCEERSIDARTDGRKRMALYRAANIVRYLRLGIEPDWIALDEVESLRKFCRIFSPKDL